MRAYDITILDEAVGKKNAIKFNKKTGKMYRPKNISDWQENALIQIKRQWLGKECLKNAMLSFVFAHKDNIRRDADNQVSTILDLLVKGGVLADDRWQFMKVWSVESFEFTDPRKKGFCTVLILEEE